MQIKAPAESQELCLHGAGRRDTWSTAGVLRRCLAPSPAIRESQPCPGILEPHPGLVLWPLVPSRCAGLETHTPATGARRERCPAEGCSDREAAGSGHVGIR